MLDSLSKVWYALNMQHAELLYQLRAKRDRQHRLRLAVAVIVIAAVFYWLANP